MSYYLDMIRCFTYIEEHLEERISVLELANHLGYSQYHFCRAFKSIQGISPGAYIRRRKMECASAALLSGQSVTAVAFTYGFDSLAGFTRAFQKECGMSPSEYYKRGKYIMKPEFKKMAAFSVIGYSLTSSETTLNLVQDGAFWQGKDFSAVSKEDYAKLVVDGHGEIGAWTHPCDVCGELRYVFGPIVANKDFIPAGMEVIDFPAADYAVFAVDDAEDTDSLAENVRKTWKFIFEEWFDSSEYRFDEKKKDYELYQGKGTYIYVPVLKK